MIYRVIAALLIFLIVLSCGGQEVEKGSPEYIKEINDWHKERINRLKKDEGWLNLAGLFWLKEGENKFGSDKDNDIIFPEGMCGYAGAMILRADSVRFISSGNCVIMSEGKKVERLMLADDMSGNPTMLQYKSFRWYIIRRGERFGIRLRNLDAELVKDFKGIDRFPVNSDWRFEAEFIKYDPQKEIIIPTAIGTENKTEAPGYLRFNKDGRIFQLDITEAEKGFFIIFADMTSGRDTYGAGRFLYCEAPDSLNHVILDFNKAYNPPCAFTPYATCPLPPEDNFINLEVKAGEKRYGDKH